MTMITEKYSWLAPYRKDIKLRMDRYQDMLKKLTGNKESLNDFANAHEYYGFHHSNEGWIYREWAPAADQLYLTGDFNNWHWTDMPMKKLKNGNWELLLPEDKIHKGSKVMTIVKNGDRLTQHLPLYTRRAVQDPDNFSWCAEVWDDLAAYDWTDQEFSCKEAPLIYEAHVGMASEEYRVASYREFADNVLQHIQDGGYNTIQLMGIMEHPYYGSFGYQVSNFYAASSRYGLPEDLKYLVNKAHRMGIRVLLDLVHSHAVKNTLEGINEFDGTSYQFFHEGAKGNHPTWGTKCFNYAKPEVLHFLLSNLKFWMTEFHFDGFRFDGVTSMLYHNHGMDSFTNLDQYFSLNTDVDAVTYLQLANKLIREVNPYALTIAEDMSGMPGMCSPIQDGGIGFDYRLGMGIPDLWIKLVKEQSDENWNMSNIWYQMTNRVDGTVAYLESHDQALVGDKTMIFRLADANMYTEMEIGRRSFVIDRATALHKMMRLLTIAAGGTAYLNFMGNEFGHPEWIDFPRPGNGGSYHYCRRQWSLLKNDRLKYQFLNKFDQDMIAAVKKYHVLEQVQPELVKIHDAEHVLAFTRGGLLFVFNFDPTHDYQDYAIPAAEGAEYRVLFTSDDHCYGGFARINHGIYEAVACNLKLHLPPRTCMVLYPEKA